MEITLVHLSGIAGLPRFVCLSPTSTFSCLSESSESWCRPSSLRSSRMYCYILLVLTFWFLLMFPITIPIPSFTRYLQIIDVTENSFPEKFIPEIAGKIYSKLTIGKLIDGLVTWKTGLINCYRVFKLEILT